MDFCPQIHSCLHATQLSKKTILLGLAYIASHCSASVEFVKNYSVNLKFYALKAIPRYLFTTKSLMF
jgi:hypothetical protein